MILLPDVVARLRRVIHSETLLILMRAAWKHACASTGARIQTGAVNIVEIRFDGEGQSLVKGERKEALGTVLLERRHLDAAELKAGDRIKIVRTQPCLIA